MKIIRLFKYFLVFALILTISGCNPQPVDFYSLPKIDAHSHIYTKNPLIIELAQEDNFKWLSITYDSRSQENIDEQLNFAISHKEQYQNSFNFTTAFSVEGFSEPNWQSNTIERLKKDFENGAVAVKVWKDIGMVFKDEQNNFIMIDDPSFDSILEFIASQGKTLVAHIGEPKNCWLAIDSMTVNNDKKYYSRHPEYHMYLHPDYPTHETIIEHRDNMLKKHPNLKVVGCHLGSLEWSVDELAKRLEAFPNFAVDVAARICHFQVQNREKVRNFLIKYQDRIIYGTDIEISENDNIQNSMAMFHEIWMDHWEYFATDSILSSTIVDNEFQGLALPKTVLEKIYYENAIKWYPGIK